MQVILAFAFSRYPDCRHLDFPEPHLLYNICDESVYGLEEAPRMRKVVWFDIRDDHKTLQAHETKGPCSLL